MNVELFRTVHGSHLYGLAHADSDFDLYIVTGNRERNFLHGRQPRLRNAKQSFAYDDQRKALVDATTVDLGTWLDMCRDGVPQALEAMFSNMALKDSISSLRANYRVNSGVYETYFDTIKSFALQDDPTIKKRRHALRLALNLNDLARYGRFNPTLSKEDARYITSMATKSHDDVYGLAKCLAWDTSRY